MVWVILEIVEVGGMNGVEIDLGGRIDKIRRLVRFGEWGRKVGGEVIDEGNVGRAGVYEKSLSLVLDVWWDIR